MCGIVGYVGSRPAVDVLIRGLRRLEYRGYDSAGVAVFHQGKIEIEKSEGKLENVEKLLKNNAEKFAASNCGIGHTRWATHGKPTTQNAHPHRASHVVLVHNGIIENYLEIKKEILARGHKIKSETDSELFGFLVLEEMDKGAKLLEAVRKSFLRVEGACSIVVMSEHEPDMIVGVRNGAPMVAAVDPKGGVAIASDSQPLLDMTQDVIFLEHGDIVVGTAKGLEFFDLTTGKPLRRETTHLDWSVETMDKQGYDHYMLKEIHEQPAALVDTLNGLLDRAHTDPFPLASQPAVKLLEDAEEIILIACGTSWHAALVGKYWFEKLARIPVQVELASEFRYRDPVLGKKALIIGLSQSGETADTLAVLREMRARGVPTIGFSNVRGSTISREASAAFYTSAGPEIGVAATKTFSTQLIGMILLAGYLGRRKDPAGVEKLFEELVKIPHLLAAALDGKEFAGQAKRAAAALSKTRGFFFMGRGLSYPIALEGALKLKEIAYVHAEGYAAGELKHGPIAMIDRDFSVVVIAPKDLWRDKTVSNLEEVKARGATVLGIGDANDTALKSLCDLWIPMPGHTHPLLSPLLTTPVVQLLSYELALLKGTDVDKPRNLAKSVTVE